MAKRFFITMSLLARVDPIRLFFMYVVIWFIVEIIFYNIEKLVGAPTVYRWYDSALSFSLIVVYVANIKYLFDVLKSRL